MTFLEINLLRSWLEVYKPISKECKKETASMLQLLNFQFMVGSLLQENVRLSHLLIKDVTFLADSITKQTKKLVSLKLEV